MSVIESKHFHAILLSLVSGLSTGIGGFIVVFLGKPKERTVGVMLGFASGVMLYVSFVNLIPETISKIGALYTAISFIAGMILFYFVIKAVPEPDPARFVALPLSPMQKDEQLYTEEDIKHNLKFIDTKLLLTGLVVATGIALHNFPEGMAVYMSTMKQYRAGLAIALAIGLHNVPEGIAVAVSMYAATRNKWEALKWSFLSGLCEPIGAIAFGLLFYGWIPETVIYGLLGGVAGLMVYICSFELITTALNYSGAQLTVISNVIGVIGLFLSNVALSYLELEH